MDQAMERFGGDENGPLWMEGAHLGIFRNEDTGTYDIDPVLVLDSVEEVEQIGAYTHSVGGAYNYADGLGYWPPYVAGGDAGGEGQAVPGEVARPGGEGGEAQPGVGPPGEAGPAGPGSGPAGDGGPEPLEVGATSEETLANLFDRIGQPEDYGTEHQGRMLGEARAYAGDGGLDEDAAKRLESAASAEPEGSNQKRLMLEAADALRGGTPDGGGDGGGAPDVAAVNSALGSVDDAIDSEVQGEDDNGPGGNTNATDEANAQLGLIRGRVTSEGPYTELSNDLRDLAQHLEDTFTLSDPSGAVQELRDAADALDGGAGPETPDVVPPFAATTPRPSATF
jgi:hypothetical protein